jgi:putative membrane protein
MVRFLIRAAIAALGLWIADKLIGGVYFTDVGTLILAAVLLGLVNAVVRPIVVFFTFPLTLLTLGLFLLVVNAAMIGLVAVFLKGFVVNGLLAGVLAAIVTGLVSWAGQAVIKDERR